MPFRPLLLFLIFFWNAAIPAPAQKPWKNNNIPKTVEESKEWANSVYKKAILKNDSMLLAEAYYLYGKNEMNIYNNYVKAKQWLLKSLDILEKRDPGFDLARLYTKLGTNELFLKNYREAYSFFLKGARTAEAARNKDAMAAAYWSLALLYSGGVDTNSSLDEILIFSPYTNKDSTSYYMEKAGKAAQAEGRSSVILSAIKLYKERTNTAGLEKLVKGISPEIAKSTFKVTTLLRLAENYIEEGNLEMAYIRLRDAEENYRQISYHPSIERTIRLIYIKYHEASGNWQKAYSLLKEVREADHALLVKERNGDISDLENSFEAEQEKLTAELVEMELALQREKARLQGWILLLAAFFIVLLIVSLGLLYLLNRKNRQISLQNALLVQEQNHRFNNNLQTVSNLLTLKSDQLNTIDAQTVLDESKLLIQAIAALQKKLYSGDKLVSVELQQLIPEVVNNVLGVFNMTQVKTRYDLMPAEVYADDALNLNLIFTELTTNACKYAFSSVVEPALEIEMTVSGDDARFIFRDNGNATWPNGSSETSSPSFGLFLVKHLVKQLQGAHRFLSDNGTVFEMNCKLRKAK